MDYSKISTLREKVYRNIMALIRQYDIGFVLDNLESLIILPVAVKIAYTSNEQHENNKKIMQQTLENAEIANGNLEKELEQRKRIFEQIRKINPSFCVDISNQMSKEEYQDYIITVKKCIRKINDLILKIDKTRDTDYSELLLSRKDLVSELIDSESTTRISVLEDEFVLRELNSIDCTNITPELQDDIDSLREKLHLRLTKNKNFYTLYSKPNCIQLKEER